MTLIEVLIALTIFAFFMSAYMYTQGSNLQDSGDMRIQAELFRHTQNKIREVLVSPPTMNESMFAAPEVKKIEDFEDFQYTLTYKKMVFPDLSKLTGQEETPTQIEGLVFKNFTQNMEKLLWQVEVSVEHLPTGRVYQLSTWMLNPKGKAAISGF